MGFDNECILNIQSLPGEYFCPVCRTLIFPNEALQSQCTHLYCKPCLAYVVATTHACPYDGYLVTEADSKPLIESNKALAETIGKVQVYCLYHRSGCQWHGTLSDCINHCAGCSFGNSPVVCNRCGTQIVHRQVQEHAQTCPGLQPQGQQADNGQVQASTGQDATQDSSAVASSVTTAAPLTAAVTVSNASATSSVSASVTTPAAPPAATAVVQSQNQGLAVAYPQAGVQAPTAEQWYQQQQQLQYQQYYQQYPGYDPYQQQYQQYGQYQQQAYQQFTQPHMQVAPQQVNTGQQQTQPFMQAQPHVQTHPQPHAQPQVQPQAQGIQPQLQPQPVPQPLPQPQPQPQPQPHPQSQLHAHPQPQLQTQPLSHAQFPQAQHIPVQQAQQAVQPQVNPQPTQVSAHPGHPQFTQLQPYPQAQQSSQIHPQQYQPAVQPQQLSQPIIQHQQPLPQSQLRPMNPTQVHLYNQPHAQFQQPHMLQQPRPLPHPQPQPLPLPQPQAQPQPQPQPQPQTQHPSVHGVTGHQSYPQPQAVQQIPPSAPQQRPMHPQQPGVPQQASQIQYPIPQLQQLRPPPTHMPMQAQQYPAMQPHAQAPFPNATLQPQALQLAHQPGQHMHHPPGMQPHPQQQALPQQQAQGHLPSSQLSQQGAFPTQPPPHSQQSLRPQVQSYMQPQLNVPPVQGRAVLPNQAITQQGQLSPAKPIQSGINQQAPLTRQHGSFQQSQLSHSGGQNSLAPAILPHSGADAAQISEAGSDLKSAVLEIPENSVLDKASQMQQLEVEVATGNADASEKSRSSDYVISKHDGDSKSLIDKKPPTDTVNEKSETKENKDDSVLNQVKGPAEDFHDGKERPHASTTVVDEVQRTEGNQNEKSVAIVDGIIAESSDGPNAAQLLPGKNKQVEMADQGNGTRGQSVGIAVSSMQVLQQMPHGQLPRDGSQLPPSQSGSVGLHGIPPAAPPNERFPPHNIPYGHPPSMADPSVVVSQRPSAPDRTFPQNIPQVGSSQERRYQESFPHQISVHGPATAPGQLRPHGYSENLGYPGQPPVMAEPFQPPGAKQPYSSNFPQKNIDEINTFPLQNQIYRPPPHVSGTGAGQIDPLSRPIISGPPPGAFDAPSGLIARGPNFGSEDQVGRSGPVNLMEGRGYYDGRMPEFHRPLSGEHPPYGQQVNSNMKMNGGKGPAGVMHDSAFSHGVPDDRFRPLPGERFKPLPEEGFRTQAEKFGPMTADPGRHIANRREFDEDFKHFPRPGHLDVDEAHRFSMYGSTGRPLDRGQQFGTDGGPRSYDRASLGSFPPYPPGGRFPPSSGVSEHGTLEIVDRQRGPPFNEDLTGKHEAVVHPERLRSFPEFGRPHFDSIPPIRSPGIPDASRRFLMEPGHLKKEIEAFDVSHTRLHAGDHAGHGLANNVRGGEPYGARNLPGHQRFGDSVGHAPLRGGEQIGFGVYGRKPVGDSGFSNSYPVHGSLSLDVDSFEHLRKRKHGSMGWCRICKIDCDTVEGLEVHSQTKDHQNMAMEIVLSIKKENAKKQKLTSEESEETNKSRKKSFENHGGRR